MTGGAPAAAGPASSRHACRAPVQAPAAAEDAGQAPAPAPATPRSGRPAVAAWSAHGAGIVVAPAVAVRLAGADWDEG